MRLGYGIRVDVITGRESHVGADCHNADLWRVRAGRAPERIAARLISLIGDRQLRPGDKLPPERDLAATMQVSRPSLREALRALAMLNIVEIRQGSGTYVSSLKPEVLIEHLDFVFALDDSTFTELLEARQMLEPGLAAAAATRATDEELAQLRACVSRAAAHVDDPEVFLTADLELHQIISAAARNQITARIMDSLTRLGVASRRRTATLPGVPGPVSSRSPGNRGGVDTAGCGGGR